MKNEIKLFLKEMGLPILLPLVVLGLAITILSATGCGSVMANGPVTVITKPTQITEDQFGDFVIRGGSLYGLPAPAGQGVRIHGNVKFEGPKPGLLQDVYVDGGCVIVDRIGRVEITRIWVEGCSGDGITFVSDPLTDSGGNQSCCAKLDHVVVKSAGGSGLKLINTRDIFVNMSEFEANANYGGESFGSPGARIGLVDFGGNGLGGFLGDRDSGFNIFTNLQFGGNRGDDLSLDGPNSVISGLSFIGPPGFCATRTTQSQVFGANFYGQRPRC